MWWLEWKSGNSSSSKQPEATKKLSWQKERVSRISNAKNVLLKTPHIELLKKTFSKKEFLLSDAWITKIASSYKKFDAKDVQDFLKKVPQTMDAKYPKTLYATALIQYADTCKSNTLSIVDYARYLQTLQDEHVRLQKLYSTFATSRDPAFASFQAFKKTYKTPWQSIDQIAQGKSFTNDTYLFFQYLSSASFQKNKQSVIAWMSASHRQEFASYLQSNVRMAQIAKVDIKVLQSESNMSISQEQQVDKQSKSFSTINDTFTKDFRREDWPKQIVDDVPETVLWSEWLDKTDIQSILVAMRKTFSRNQWELFYKRFVSFFPKKLPQEKALQALLWEKASPKIISIVENIFSRIVKDELQPTTKNAIQQHVMKLYFEQVSSVLQAWGDVVSLDEKGIQYNKDWSIEMAYETKHGIRGTITIDQTWRVSLTDMFAYPGTWEGASWRHIIQKLEKHIMDNGWLPSMKKMMEHAAGQKLLIFDQWQSSIAENDSSVMQVDILTPYIVTEQDEQERTALASDMWVSLLMTQSMDRLTEWVTYTRRITQSQSQDMFSRYIEGREQFIDTKLYPDYSALQPLRETLRWSNRRVIERWNASYATLIDTYQHNAHTSKDTFPFALDDQPGKETLFQFLSRFCISDQQFDIQAFESVVHAIIAEKTPPVSMGEFYVDHISLFPSKSLFTIRYPDMTLQSTDKENSQVTLNTKKSLDDLRLDVEMIQKLE
jgi:hypothetical protein